MRYVEVELTDIAHGGSCVGRADDGRVVFARFGLPGERVRVQLTAERSKLLRGDVVEVLGAPSEHRVETRWPEAGPLGVGGAELGHVAFGYQKDWKTHVLRAQLARLGGQELADHLREAGINPCVREVGGTPDGWHTRTRVEFVAGPGGAPSMYREGSNELLPVSSLPLAVEEIDELEIFGAWKSWWKESERVRLVAPSGSDPVVVLGETAWNSPGIRADRYVREDVIVDGELYAYRVRAAGFWQVHRHAAAEIISMVLGGAKVEEGQRVVELYSGAGMLTQPLAAAVGAGGEVMAFEGVRQATEDARANLREFAWASAKTASIDARFAEGINADVLVADPPRAGLGVELASTLARASVDRIVLVSCDPAAMARDLATMHSCGRRIESIDVVDLFPNTHHFESVAVVA